MSIFLGNMQADEIQKRLGITLAKEEKNKLNSHIQQSASNIAKDKCHCFDIPFVIVCGSYDVAVLINEILSPYSNDMKTQIQISIEEATHE